jgi:uncharacterized protein YhbP (UPF0306 family)
MQDRADDATLHDRVAGYLRAHHTMTVATVSQVGNSPHAASVFYAVDDKLRLVFLSKPGSVHGMHIGDYAPVAVTVTEDYADWEKIQGVQLWGDARLLKGEPKAAAFALYIRRFPFVRDVVRRPKMAEVLWDIGVYEIVPIRAAFTDNTTGIFGREMLELEVD